MTTDKEVENVLQNWIFGLWWNNCWK